jgi:hypothetical protein
VAVHRDLSEVGALDLSAGQIAREGFAPPCAPGRSSITGRKEAYLTPPALAKAWGCKASTVLGFIRNGELAAVNLARRGAKRPRWRISPEAIRDFEHARTFSPQQVQVRRRHKAEGVIEFF